MKKYTSLAVLAALFLSTSVNAGLIFNYSQLALKDLDQMSKFIQVKINESRKSNGDKVVPLKECLQAVYSRGNEDFMIEKIVSPLKAELEEYSAWEKTIQDLVKEAVGALKNPKAFQPAIQVTYVIFLENMMAEMRPHIGEDFENKIIKRIRDAKIEIKTSTDTERRLRVMKGAHSPSDIAASLLTEFEEASANKAKQVPIAGKPDGKIDVKADGKIDGKEDEKSVAKPESPEQPGKN